MIVWPEGARFYSPSCHKLPLICTDEARMERAGRYGALRDMSDSVQSALRVYELTGATVFEFVAFSNLRLPAPVQLHNGVTLFPCFYPAGMAAPMDELAALTHQMSMTERFIYDGRLAIEEWEPDKVAVAVRWIDEALSLFALRERIHFTWEAKYPAIEHSAIYSLPSRDLIDLQQFVERADMLPTADRQALYRSIGWLTQAARLVDPAARFLFCVLTIESLSAYIEEKATDDSPLATLRGKRGTRAERRKEREDCIRRVLAERLEDNPTEAIKDAYFTCVTSIRAQIEGNIGRVYEGAEFLGLYNPAALFQREEELPSLYDLRHTVAHGTMDTLSEAERERLRDRAPEVEIIARQYIMLVLYKAIGLAPLLSPVMGSVTMNMLNAVSSAPGMYHGPTHLAQIYMGAGPHPYITLPEALSTD